MFNKQLVFSLLLLFNIQIVSYSYLSEAGVSLSIEKPPRDFVGPKMGNFLILEISNQSEYKLQVSMPNIFNSFMHKEMKQNVTIDKALNCGYSIGKNILIGYALAKLTSVGASLLYQAATRNMHPSGASGLGIVMGCALTPIFVLIYGRTGIKVVSDCYNVQSNILNSHKLDALFYENIVVMPGTTKRLLVPVHLDVSAEDDFEVRLSEVSVDVNFYFSSTVGAKKQETRLQLNIS